MQDRVPLYPGRIQLIPVDGQENTYDLVRADQATQAGDPLNKTTLLKDATAALYGLTSEAVPDDVLSILSKAILNGDSEYTDVNGVAVSQIKIETGSYVGTGTYGSSNPCRLTFKLLPKLLVIQAQSGYCPFMNYGSGGYVGFNDVLVATYSNYSSSLGTDHVWTWSGNTFKWYSDRNAHNQENASGITYKYVAIG